MCDLIWWWLIEHRDESEVSRLEARLTAPPEGYEGSLEGTAWSDDAMLADFDAFATDFARLSGGSGS